MPTQRVAIDTVKSALEPVRLHPIKQMKKVRKSLATFGQVRPLLVAPNGEIIDTNWSG